MTALPAVDVVIATRDRPELVRAAIASVQAQDYAGRLAIFVVFDGTEPDRSLVDDGPVPVTVIPNERKPGLCGARNTGIVAGSGELVAFLDDDDYWLPGKLRKQVELFSSRPQSNMATTGIKIKYGEEFTDRLAGTEEISHERVLARGMLPMHPSSVLLRRAALLGTPGLVDETSPNGQNEDWDLLLRYSATAPIANVDEPLVVVRWGVSTFIRDWQGRIDGANWIFANHPELKAHAAGYARVLGQVAFGYAAMGKRRHALRTALLTARTRWREPRAYLALAVAAGLRAEWVLALLHKRGRGI